MERPRQEAWDDRLGPVFQPLWQRGRLRGAARGRGSETTWERTRALEFPQKSL